MNAPLPTTPTPPTPITSEPPRVVMPDAATIFAARADRFEHVATGHALGDWLRFLAALSRAQHTALQTLPALTLPTAEQLAAAALHGFPPLAAPTWARDAAWRDVLKAICADLAPTAPAPARHHLDRLQALPMEALEALASRVLNSDLEGAETALLPYVGAALQVLWTGAAARLGQAGATLDTTDPAGVCPCCGFLPVASVVRDAGGVSNLRYLHCALCNTEWNLVRVKCCSCEATGQISYRQLEPGEADPSARLAESAASVQAETCEDCQSYLKIVHPGSGHADPVADDLATLALDILVDEAGYSRSGPNLLWMPG